MMTSVYLKYSTPLLVIAAGGLLMLLSRWLEQSLIASLLFAYPALVLFGYALGVEAIKGRLFSSIVGHSGGVPGVLVATFSLVFWMIPRWMDASVAHLEIAIIKYLCLMFLVGFPLGVGWSKMHFITRAVVKIEFLTMLFRLGWIYLISPDRLCNSYLIGEQVLLGKMFIAIALLLVVLFCAPLFVAAPGKQDACNGGALCPRC
jgi:hypothetical protein